MVSQGVHRLARRAHNLSNGRVGPWRASRGNRPFAAVGAIGVAVAVAVHLAGRVGNPGAAREQLHSLLRSVPHSIFQAARACRCRTQRATVCERRARVRRDSVCTKMLAVTAGGGGPMGGNVNVDVDVDVCLTGASVRDCDGGDSWTRMVSAGASSVQQVRAASA